MDSRKILVTGSNGVVGSYIPAVFTESTICLTSHTDMDVANRSEVIKTVFSVNPKVIIHLAAKTDVDDCEKNKQAAADTNFHGTQHIAYAARLIGATVIYVSTCAIFDGKKKFYIETDRPHPLNTYGKTKLSGERAISSTLEKYYIIRAGWIVGGGGKDKKFISYILSQLRMGKKEIFAVNDMFGSITYAKELVKFMKQLLYKEPYGIYHFSSQGVCSRYDIAKAMIEILGVSVIITPVDSKKFHRKFFAPRPTYEVVRSIKNKYTTSWQESLKAYIQSEIQFT